MTAFQDHILDPCLQFIELDCERNTNRPISLLQVATPTVFILVRLCKMDFLVAKNVRLVLEDPTIYKVNFVIGCNFNKFRGPGGGLMSIFTFSLFLIEEKDS